MGETAEAAEAELDRTVAAGFVSVARVGDLLLLSTEIPHEQPFSVGRHRYRIRPMEGRAWVSSLSVPDVVERLGWEEVRRNYESTSVVFAWLRI